MRSHRVVNRSNKYRQPLLFLLAGILACSQVWAQEAVTPEDIVPEATPVVADEFNRGTPLQSGDAFMRVADTGNFEVAAEYLDLRNLRGSATELTGAQLARRLYVIINRASWIDVDELVDDVEGRANDGLPDFRDSIGVILNKEKPVRLLMQKVPRGDGESIWKVSNATVSLVPELYDVYGYPEFVEKLRRQLPVGSFLGYEFFKLIVVVAGALAAYFAVFLLALVIRRVLGNANKPSNQRVFRFLVIPFGVWIVLLAVNYVATSLGRGVTAEYIRQISPVAILVTVWAAFAGINLFGDIYSNHLQGKGRHGSQVLLRPASNAIKLLVFLIAVLIYLDKLGINITTVLAGLGVGGVAVALALQKPMEDIFGAITLYTQQPVRIGDFCRVGKVTGTIEEIGLRTTYIRTLANTVIAVPNSVLAGQPIDNISARQKILYRPGLRLRYDTDPTTIRNVLGGIREMLEKHERVLNDGSRVRFNEIGDDALKIDVFAYVNTTDWQEYLQLAEELNLMILDIVTSEGTSLSLPASTLHIEQDNDD